jgi:glycosyltransferase involved in cell wall biosynthesis
LNCTSILIQPSLTDAGPLVPLEAMSCGIPVVATNVGGNPEEIINGITGLIVPENDLISLGEAIIKLLNNDEFRQEMGNNARKWVKSKFDSRALIDNIEYVYDTLMNKPKDTNIN